MIDKIFEKCNGHERLHYVIIYIHNYAISVPLIVFLLKNYQRDRYGIIMYIDYYIVQSFMTITFFKYFVNHYNFIVQYCTYKACFNMVSIWFYCLKIVVEKSQMNLFYLLKMHGP